MLLSAPRALLRGSLYRSCFGNVILDFTEAFSDPYFIRQGWGHIIVSGCAFKEKAPKRKLVAAQFSIKGCGRAGAVLTEN